MKRAVTAIMLAGIFPGCSSETDFSETGSGQSEFSIFAIHADSDGATRVRFGEWSMNDRIGIFALKGGVAERINMAYELRNWWESYYGTFDYVPYENNERYETDYNESSTYTFNAYYPYYESEGSEVSRTFDHRNAPDLLFATATVNGAEKNVQLKFRHMLSKIVFEIDRASDNVSLEKAEIYFSGLDPEVQFNAGSSGINVTGNRGQDKYVYMDPKDKRFGVFEYLFVPQTPLNGKLIIKVSGVQIGEEPDFTYLGEVSLPKIEASKVYTVKMSLNANGTVSFRGSQIKDWSTSSLDLKVDLL